MTQHEDAVENNLGNTVDLLISIESLLTSIDGKLERLITAVRQSR